MNVRIYDDPRTIDRFTVVYLDHPERAGLFAARAMSDHPFHPLGFCQCTQAKPGRHLGRRIAFDDLPADCQRVIISDLSEVAA